MVEKFPEAPGIESSSKETGIRKFTEAPGIESSPTETGIRKFTEAPGIDTSSQGTGSAPQLNFRYNHHSSTQVQSRTLFPSTPNVQGIIQGDLDTVTPGGASGRGNVYYQVNQPPGHGGMTINQIMTFINTRTALGNGGVTQMDVVVYDLRRTQQSEPVHREEHSGSKRPPAEGKK
ncbi:hypothetical protein CLAFUW4_10939 [Fulvia fulva]|nr:hypothetical protein CLAFUR4_10944 [Fulvia fulva]KAK4620909.1 hypothetical protein CLAFUR0_10951 [Fulvia fulva]WPV17398.1 hypothetical protein CLAFUW4_10939 [Fulvia fulva]WPV32443.1 hypothetical protein CLAFUW7_10937 [Fulvia fulva]